MSNTFTPGPAPNTVRAADGKILTVPDGWVLLPPGDAALTRRVKAAGDHWIVQEKVRWSRPRPTRPVTGSLPQNPRSRGRSLRVGTVVVQLRPGPGASGGPVVWLRGSHSDPSPPSRVW